MVAAYNVRVMEGYVTLLQLAGRLGLETTGGLRVRVARGSLKAERIGRDWVVTEEEAEHFVREYSGKPRPRLAKNKHDA